VEQSPRAIRYLVQRGPAFGGGPPAIAILPQCRASVRPTPADEEFHMRLLFGIILGIALTVGAAFLHDNNVPPDPPSSTTGEKQIVNWDILGDVVHEQVAGIRRLWARIAG
jgi:hypothetical protein